MNSFNQFPLLSFVFLSLLVSCSAPSSDGDAAEAQAVQASMTTTMTTQADPGPFANTVQGLDKYWYQGLGELNTYELEQNRYQGIHKGQLLLIFVSEDFLTDKQVKNDRYQNPNSTKILKTNSITRFTTGLYDYSIMSSIFTPAYTKDYPRTLKVSHTSQDWCGQTYAQVNLQEDGGYQQQLHSYFENEADQTEAQNADALEDELLNRIRLSPADLPTGNLNLIPAMTFLRLRHQPFRAVAANVSLADYSGDEFEGEDLKIYTLEYPSLKRKVEYVFDGVSPYRIQGFTDSYPSAFDGVIRTTKATRKETKLEAYWSQNSNSSNFTSKRADLGWK
ncbi:MAG: hypothetical protein AAFR36_06590 [Bacteroidota bacterium]